MTARYGHGRWCECDPCRDAAETIAEARADAADEALSDGESAARDDAYERAMWGES